MDGSLLWDVLCFFLEGIEYLLLLEAKDQPAGWMLGPVLSVSSPSVPKGCRR